MIDHILGKDPHDGLVEPGANMRLRIGVIDNPTYYREKGTKLNPLNPVGIINTLNGKICVRWLDVQGGIIQKEDSKGKMKSDIKKVKTHGEIGEIQENSTGRETLELTHPFIWANNTNWCGMNYLPPVGTIVVIGFRKNNLPIILGYLNPNYKTCNPIKLGETMIKGYGGNYIHWKQSDRLGLKVESIKGEHDLDHPQKTKINDSNCVGAIDLDANDKFIRLNINELGGSNGSVGVELKLSTTKAELKAWSSSGSSTFSLSPNGVDVNTTGDFNVKASRINLN